MTQRTHRLRKAPLRTNPNNRARAQEAGVVEEVDEEVDEELEVAEGAEATAAEAVVENPLAAFAAAWRFGQRSGIAI